MSLGADPTTCTTELLDAMRARLEAETPGSGANVDLPQVRPNFDALGLAVFRIATVHAETRSNAGSDAAFWAWVTAVHAWAAALAQWQADVQQAITGWAPASLPEQNFRAALLAAAPPAPPPIPAAAPAQIDGRVR